MPPPPPEPAVVEPVNAYAGPEAAVPKKQVKEVRSEERPLSFFVQSGIDDEDDVPLSADSASEL